MMWKDIVLNYMQKMQGHEVLYGVRDESFVIDYLCGVGLLYVCIQL